MRRISTPVRVGNVMLGGNAPIIIQSMTNTDTADIDSTVHQILELSNAGSEMVRITVDRPESAEAVPQIVERVRKFSPVPIIGDFHFNGHILLKKYPDMAKCLDKYRINPGNIGRGEKRDSHFETILEMAQKYKKPIRIGVNGGSLDPELLAEKMDKNRMQKTPRSDTEIFEETLQESALASLAFAESFGIPLSQMVISAKVSEVTSLIRIHRFLADRTQVAIHLGLTEAGGGLSGIISSTSGLSVLLLEGIGDTIRVSYTPSSGESRIQEVRIAREILQSLGLRTFFPKITSCPGCGRTTGNHFQEFSEKIRQEVTARLPKWKQNFPGSEKLKIAVMGCIVNGPGEARSADIGIFFPGRGEGKVAEIYGDGEKICNISGEENISEIFFSFVEEYLQKRFIKK